MVLHSSGEDYLKAILILQKNNGKVRSVDVAAYMGVSKPSVSHAVKLLREGGFLTKDSDHFLHLTALGQETERRKNFMNAISFLQSTLPVPVLILRLRRKKPAVWNTQSAMNRSMS